MTISSEGCSGPGTVSHEADLGDSHSRMACERSGRSVVGSNLRKRSSPIVALPIVALPLLPNAAAMGTIFYTGRQSCSTFICYGASRVADNVISRFDGRLCAPHSSQLLAGFGHRKR
jgi:hypothetical protein